MADEGLFTALGSDLFGRLIDEWPIARLASVTAEGAAHAVPVVFCRCDDTLYSPLDGKRKAHPNLKRVKNVAHNDRVCLLLDHYDAEWQRLWWVRIDCRAATISPDDVQLQQLRGALMRKYPQYESIPPFADPPVALQLRMERLSAWAQAGREHALRQSIAESLNQ